MTIYDRATLVYRIEGDSLAGLHAGALATSLGENAVLAESSRRTQARLRYDAASRAR